MSGGAACNVRDRGHRHVVTARRSNRSAFSGYRWTPSAYSEVLCINDNRLWRTKAAYVDSLPDATSDDWAAIGITNPNA